MRISNPTESDRTSWKCFLGVMELGMKKTLGAIVDASVTPPNFAESIEADDVYSMVSSPAQLLCKNKLAAEYCWFQHPNGRRITVSEHAMHAEMDEFR